MMNNQNQNNFSNSFIPGFNNNPLGGNNNFNNQPRINLSYNEIFNDNTFGNDNNNFNNNNFNNNNNFGSNYMGGNNNNFGSNYMGGNNNNFGSNYMGGNNNNNFGSNYMGGNNNNFGSNGDDILNNPDFIKRSWQEKISRYNDYINQGKFTYNSEKLKEGINEIIDNLSSIEGFITKFSLMNNNQARHDMVNIRNDMEQTLFRYNNLMKDKKVEPFVSAFDGNTRRYEYNPDKFYSGSNYIPYNNYEEVKTVSTVDKIKKGIINIGHVIKEKSLDGYDFIKEKITGEESNRRNPEIENQYYSYNVGKNKSYGQQNTYSTYKTNDNSYQNSGQYNNYGNYNNNY